MGKALKHFGLLLPPETRRSRRQRLNEAADYIYTTFDLTFTNITCGISEVYALPMLSEVFDEPRQGGRSKELAA